MTHSSQEVTLNCPACSTTNFVREILENNYTCKSCRKIFESSLLYKKFDTEKEDKFYLESFFFAFRDTVKQLEDRLHALENSPFAKSTTYAPLFERLDSLELRIKEAERFQDITHRQYQKNISTLEPYKCPVCDGSGKNFIDPLSGIEGAFLPKDERGMQYRNCHPCKSVGVIWN